MRTKRILLAFCGVAIAMATLYHAETVHATPASGFSTVYVLKGATFKEFFLFQRASKDQLPPGNTDTEWWDLQWSKGHSDLYVVQNTWQPTNFDGNGGIASTGWHTHPGPSLVTVIEGTLTVYEAADPTCTPTTYTAGESFTDIGCGEVHNVVNETGAEAKVVAVQIVPAGQPRRIDEPAPGNCPALTCP